MCKYFRKVLSTRQSRIRRATATERRTVAQKLRCASQQNRHFASRIGAMKDTIRKMRALNASATEEALNEQISKLPPKQPESVRQCFLAPRVKKRGFHHSKMRILECIIMKKKSVRLYDHVRDNEIFALPSKSTLKRYMAVYRTSFGFSKKVLEKLKLKTQDKNSFKKHGGLLVDELKLLEHLCVKHSGQIEGFVDLGDYTSAEEKSVQSDHGMVIMFVPFVSKWSQVIGTFATSGNIKGDLLAQVLIEVTILAEKSGLFLDFITCYGAS